MTDHPANDQCLAAPQARRARAPVWAMILGAASLVAACETPQEKQVRENQAVYTQATGLPAGSVVSVVQKGFSEGNATFTVYYYSDKITEAQLTKTPSILCRERRQSEVKSAEHQALSEMLQKAQPKMKKLFIRCVK
jgi:hypothetical protein